MENTACSEPCPHRVWSGESRLWGENVPLFAQGAYFPGENPGPRCALERRGRAAGDEACTPHPSQCPAWEKSGLICPACLEFAERRYPRSLFHEAALRRRGARLYCPDCGEEYANAPALAASASARLRDVLDDLDFSRSGSRR